MVLSTDRTGISSREAKEGGVGISGRVVGMLRHGIIEDFGNILLEGSGNVVGEIVELGSGDEALGYVVQAGPSVPKVNPAYSSMLTIRVA